MVYEIVMLGFAYELDREYACQDASHSNIYKYLRANVNYKFVHRRWIDSGVSFQVASQAQLAQFPTSRTIKFGAGGRARICAVR